MFLLTIKINRKILYERAIDPLVTGQHLPRFEITPSNRSLNCIGNENKRGQLLIVQKIHTFYIQR